MNFVTKHAANQMADEIAGRPTVHRDHDKLPGKLVGEVKDGVAGRNVTPEQCSNASKRNTYLRDAAAAKREVHRTLWYFEKEDGSVVGALRIIYPGGAKTGQPREVFAVLSNPQLKLVEWPDASASAGSGTVVAVSDDNYVGGKRPCCDSRVLASRNRNRKRKRKTPLSREDVIRDKRMTRCCYESCGQCVNAIVTGTGTGTGTRVLPSGDTKADNETFDELFREYSLSRESLGIAPRFNGVIVGNSRERKLIHDDHLYKNESSCNALFKAAAAVAATKTKTKTKTKRDGMAWHVAVFLMYLYYQGRGQRPTHRKLIPLFDQCEQVSRSLIGVERRRHAYCVASSSTPIRLAGFDVDGEQLQGALRWCGRRMKI